MGGSQSQEDRSQTFSTIGLPPSSLYPTQERSQSVSVPRGTSRRDHLYRSNTDQSSSANIDETNEWLRIERPPTHAPLPPRPPPPRAHHSPSTQDSRSSRRQQPPPPTSQSLREYNEFDLEQLLSTLHSLSLSSRSHTDGSPGSEPERRRRHHHEGSGSGRHRHRLRHRGPGILFMRPQPDEKCPLCSKEFSATEFEAHLATCSQRPRVQFNEDKLRVDTGECSICLEDLVAGDKIARLPCLCVYHLECLKGWYKKSQTCPEHPDMKVI